MVKVTLRVLDGADRGKVFQELETPITIGREEGNVVQLNDDRVSRFHIKIQEDHDALVLTDLESTNGTKVNGEDIQLKILRFGDLISVGRSVMLFGSRTQIASRMRQQHGDDELSRTMDPEKSNPANYDFELNWQGDGAESPIHPVAPPDLPERLSPGQAAQLVEVLEYLHLRLRNLAGSVSMDKDTNEVRLDLERWQGVLDLQARLSEYLRAVSDPNSRGISS